MYPDDIQDTGAKQYALPSKKKGAIKPPENTDANDQQAAIEVIRKKLDALYAAEPPASEEIEEIKHTPGRRSKHQEFMQKLSTSGMPLAEIQTKWHEYYQGLPDNEKHEVWQEFYRNHSRLSEHEHRPAAAPEPQSPAQPAAHRSAVSVTPKVRAAHRTTRRTADQIKHQLVRRVEKRGKLSRKQHAQSLLFGLGIGVVAIAILLFGFFNERFIAPFITPSKNVSSTPIIIDPNSAVVDTVPKIIIPKINVEIPVVYDEPSVEEKAIQNALERGVVHYATTPSPGEQGNAVIFGHSSNNIFNRGQYKFAFVLLSRLEAGDTFYLTKGGKRYVYRVYDKKIVKPTDVWVMGNTDKPATATLITCDPPGTTINRLVVIGEQISPDPAANVASTAIEADLEPAIVPSNAPSLWQRLTSWLTS